MADQPNVRWAGRAAFAEVAEALGCRTDQVMSVYGTGSRLMVLYSPTMPADAGADYDGPTYRVALRRRVLDGVLEPATEPEEVPGLWADIRAGVERTLKRLGQ